MTVVMERDVIIVGGGAAGLNAALVLGRARRNVLVCDDGRPRNAVAENMHGFLSRDGTPPAKLLEIARGELKAYPSVELFNENVDRATSSRDSFTVILKSGDRFAAKRLLLANGVKDKLPTIENLADFWGRYVFVCPFCDGWEFRDRNIAVYGRGDEVVELAQELYGWTKNISICIETATAKLTPKNARWLAATGSKVLKGALRKLVGNSNGELVALESENDERCACDALFLSAPLRQSCTIAAELGCKIDKAGAVIVDDQCQTSVQGCYAAGDAVTDVHQTILAAASGVRAAIAISIDLLCGEADSIARQKAN
jgi:thioredoxin reductase